MVEPAPAPGFSPTPGDTAGPAPEDGEHTDEILGQCGSHDAVIDDALQVIQELMLTLGPLALGLVEAGPGGMVAATREAQRDDVGPQRAAVLLQEAGRT